MKKLKSIAALLALAAVTIISGCAPSQITIDRSNTVYVSGDLTEEQRSKVETLVQVTYGSDTLAAATSAVIGPHAPEIWSQNSKAIQKICLWDQGKIKTTPLPIGDDGKKGRVEGQFSTKRETTIRYLKGNKHKKISGNAEIYYMTTKNFQNLVDYDQNRARECLTRIADYFRKRQDPELKHVSADLLLGIYFLEELPRYEAMLDGSEVTKVPWEVRKVDDEKTKAVQPQTKVPTTPAATKVKTEVAPIETKAKAEVIQPKASVSTVKKTVPEAATIVEKQSGSVEGLAKAEDKGLTEDFLLNQ